MLLIDSQIKAAIASGALTIENFNDERLEAASYDARIGDFAMECGTAVPTSIKDRGHIVVRPGEFVLIMTRERFSLGGAIVANLGLLSTLGRKGLQLLAGMQIDPGFDGHLAIAVHNVAPGEIVLRYEEELVTIQFFELETNVEKPHRGNVDLKQGAFPKADIEYVRFLRAPSLYKLNEEVQ